MDRPGTGSKRSPGTPVRPPAVKRKRLICVSPVRSSSSKVPAGLSQHLGHFKLVGSPKRKSSVPKRVTERINTVESESSV